MSKYIQITSLLWWVLSKGNHWRHKKAPSFPIPHTAYFPSFPLVVYIVSPLFPLLFTLFPLFSPCCLHCFPSFPLVVYIVSPCQVAAAVIVTSVQSCRLFPACRSSFPLQLFSFDGKTFSCHLIYFFSLILYTFFRSSYILFFQWAFEWDK